MTIASKLTRSKIKSSGLPPIARVTTVTRVPPDLGDLKDGRSFSKSKFGNKSQVVDGLKFASKREARRWSELKLLERAGDISDLRRQVRYPLHVNGAAVCAYVSDFDYMTKTGQPITEDSKGFRTPIYRIKAKLFKAIYGREILET